VHEGITYTRGQDGAFDFPEHVGREVHGFHVNRVPLWETEVEQQQRFIAEDTARRSDPASQYDLLERIAAKGQAPSPVSELAELRKRIAELEAAAKAAAEPEDDGEEDGEGVDDPDAESAAKPAAKSARSRKPAAEPAGE
jgi:phage shock protein A